MKPEQFLNIMDVAEKLKCNTRHSWTSNGRHESVAEHSWRLSLMAIMMEDEFPEIDINKVIKMCILHDMGEAFTGDIPSFEKTREDEGKEEAILADWVTSLPEPYRTNWEVLYQEISARETIEAKLYKAMDNLEAVIQHNEADIATWLPLEYELQLTYGADKVGFSPYLRELKAALEEQTRSKIADGKEIGNTKVEKELTTNE